VFPTIHQLKTIDQRKDVLDNNETKLKQKQKKEKEINIHVCCVLTNERNNNKFIQKKKKRKRINMVCFKKKQ